MTASANDRALERRATNALLRAVARVPALRCVAARAKVVASTESNTVDVSPEARIRVRPSFAARLDDDALEFVMAHELMHLLLRSHDRQRGYDPRAFNWAHDAVINDTLAPLFGGRVPDGGVLVAGARFLSAEALLDAILARGDAPWERGYEPDVVRTARIARGTLPHASRGSDPSWEALEVSLWPDGTIPAETEARAASVLDFHRISGRVRADDSHRSPRALSALAGWLDTHTRDERSYARPSRRGQHAVVVTKGRNTARIPLTVLLDVSSSMVEQHRRMLGLLRAACACAGVNELRFVHSDDRITSDTFCDPSALANPILEGSGDREVMVMPSICDSCGSRHGFRPQGAPRTDLRSAIAEVARPGSALLVVTDGRIADIGERPGGVDVAWLVSEAFRPAWGRVVTIEST